MSIGSSLEGEMMTSSRLETFSDGVLAIVITIMVLELQPPHEASWEALEPLVPVFLSYLLSFVYLGIYWNNHHHMLVLIDRVNGKILWANLHLLFWLSLFPFMTAWLGESDFEKVPAAMYGVISLMAAIAYFILQRTIIGHQGPDSSLALALGRDTKGKISPFLYVAGIILAPVSQWLSIALYVGVALMWLVPDSRIEAAVVREEQERSAPGS